MLLPVQGDQWLKCWSYGRKAGRHRSTYVIHIGRYSRDEDLRYTTFEEKVAYFPPNHASWKNLHPSAPENLQPSQVEPLPLSCSVIGLVEFEEKSSA